MTSATSPSFHSLEGGRWASSSVWSPGPAPAPNRGPGPPPGSAAACALWLCGPAGVASESGQRELPHGGYVGDRTGSGTRPPPTDRGPAGPSPILPPAWTQAGTAPGQTGPSAEHPPGWAGDLPREGGHRSHEWLWLQRAAAAHMTCRLQI